MKTINDLTQELQPKAITITLTANILGGDEPVNERAHGAEFLLLFQSSEPSDIDNLQSKPLYAGQ